MILTQLHRFKIDESLCWIWIFTWANASIIVCWRHSLLACWVRYLQLSRSFISDLHYRLIIWMWILSFVYTVSMFSLSTSIFSVISIIMTGFSIYSCDPLSIDSIWRKRLLFWSSFTVTISQCSNWMTVSVGQIFQSISIFKPISLAPRASFSISSSVSS